MSTSPPLLLEIGVEELPSSFVDGARAALPTIGAEELANVRLVHGQVRALGTPRRLAVHVAGVATKQLDLDEEIVGPPEAFAFKDGKPTKAAEAFAAKLGAPLASLVVHEKPGGPKQKPRPYHAAGRTETGETDPQHLGGVLATVFWWLEIPLSMARGNLGVT